MHETTAQGMRSMEALQVLFTTDVGLFSLAVIVGVLAIGWYLKRHITKLMNDAPGKEGWN
jgi:hypothetical protein